MRCSLFAVTSSTAVSSVAAMRFVIATGVEISAGVVLLRDSQGRLRRLSTGGASR
jgi:hypothetical protein